MWGSDHYLFYGFDSNSPGNHEKLLGLQFIEPHLRLISYLTGVLNIPCSICLRNWSNFLQLNVDPHPLVQAIAWADMGGTDWFSLRYCQGNL
ncbi:YqiA/YcfP family alpha/beta fold hydrolase [Escherichia coli]